jgi:hypothetical protein
MITDARSSRSEAAPVSLSPPSLVTRLYALKARAIASLVTWARAQGAAAVYRELARLSDAELRHRGLSRGTLARDVCEACSRPSTR